LGQIPNLISGFRLLAAPLLMWLICTDHFGWALLLTIPIGISDWADGYLARRLEVTSRFGTYIDPAADKVLLVTTFLSLGLDGAIPRWLVGLVIGRDIVIVAGASLLWKLRHQTKFTPLVVGKISTTFQIITVLVVLMSRVFLWRAMHGALLTCFALTAIFTVISGAGYIRKGIRLAGSDPVGSSIRNIP
jgi:cardiolipin synthase